MALQGPLSGSRSQNSGLALVDPSSVALDASDFSSSSEELSMRNQGSESWELRREIEEEEEEEVGKNDVAYPTRLWQVRFRALELYGFEACWV